MDACSWPFGCGFLRLFYSGPSWATVKKLLNWRRSRRQIGAEAAHEGVDTVGLLAVEGDDFVVGDGFGAGGIAFTMPQRAAS